MNVIGKDAVRKLLKEKSEFKFLIESPFQGVVIDLDVIAILTPNLKFKCNFNC